jgi:peptidoglycan-associated lipoprotein
MNSVNFTYLLIASALLLLPASGCRKSPKSVTHIPGRTAMAPGTATPSGIASSRLDPGSALPGGLGTSSSQIPYNEDGTVPLGSREDEGNYWVDRDFFRDQTVYFEFDSSAVQSGDRPKLEQVASFLKSEPGTRLRVEGHCDERGTDEYNRALGERRALAVREFLVLLGVSPDRVSTVSFGEDRPVAFGSDEASMAQNRRGELVLLRPKS